jgi:hypothetical protein
MSSPALPLSDLRPNLSQTKKRSRADGVDIQFRKHSRQEKPSVRPHCR